MYKQLILFFFLTTVTFSITIEEAMIYKYGSYISSSILFITLLIIFLFYWTFKYKKKIRQLKYELKLVNDTLKDMQESMKTSEQVKASNDYEQEKQILTLIQTVKSLEDKLKDGLKSQVVNKIEEYQNKRTKHLNRLNTNG